MTAPSEAKRVRPSKTLEYSTLSMAPAAADVGSKCGGSSCMATVMSVCAACAVNVPAIRAAALALASFDVKNVIVSLSLNCLLFIVIGP